MWASAFLLIGLVLANEPTAIQVKKSVVVSLNGKWASSSLIAETSEFFAQQSNSSFWAFVDGVSQKCESMDWALLNDEKKYDISIKQAASVLGDSSLDLLKFSLSLREFSPAVQLFQQIGSEYKNVDCEAFFDVQGATGCSAAELEKAVEKASGEKPTIFSVDHVFPGSDENPVTVIVYGDIGSPHWRALHNAARSLAKNGKARYALRHYRKNPSGRVSLSGYGVELSIKNTEYKAEDDSNKKNEEVQQDEEDLHGFNFKLLKELHADSKDSLDALRMHLKEIEELAPLKQWQVQDLAFQAAQKIVSTEPENAMALLKELAQNFPLHARTIARESVTKTFRQEVTNNQDGGLAEAGISPGETALLLNGINLDVDRLSVFELMEYLKKEEILASGFYNLGIKREYLSILVGMELSDSHGAYAVDFREARPFYINNLDSDKRYKGWANSVKLMLQQYYPGMVRPIARNLFNLIFVLDPSNKESRKLLEVAYSVFQNEIPFRVGFIFAVNPDRSVSGLTDVGVAALNLFNFELVDSGVEDAIKTLNDLFYSSRTSNDLTTADIKSWFEKQTRFADVEYESVFGPDSDYDSGRTLGAEFVEKSAIGAAPKVLLNGYVLNEVNPDRFDEVVMHEVMRITPRIQKAVMSGKLTDRANVMNWIMDQSNVLPRLNARILDAPATKKYIDLSDSNKCTAKTLSDFNPLSVPSKTRCMMDKMKYLSKSDDDFIAETTIWVVADVETPEGRDLYYSAIKRLKHSKTARVGLIMNPIDLDQACKADSISSLVQASIRLLPHHQAKQMTTKLVKEEFVEALKSGKTTLEELVVAGMNIDHFKKEKKLLPCDRLRMESRYATEVLGLKAGARAVVANSLIVGPLNDGESLIEADFALLEKVLSNRGSSVIAKNIKNWEVETENGRASDLLVRASALIGEFSVPKKRTWIVLQGDEHSSVTLVADDNNRATLDIVAIVDPLSQSAQKLSSILEVIRKTVNCDLKLVMNPKPKLSELPLKRFYRYVVAPELHFDPNGNVAPLSARFTHLPSKQLLAMSVHAPGEWMIENVHADYDLDNIKMSQASSDIVALYSLEYILLEGHCFDDVTGSPPRGLQFVLGTKANPTQFDTIVMANLGYFQLKANPGAWQLRLREGKSKEIYDIANHAGTEGNEGDAVLALINSFSGRTIRVKVFKRPGMEERNLLTDDNGEGSILGSFSGWGGSEKHETINVFSLASGHLYERFMRIMILSVMKKTTHPVKFWLLKTYLSPQFKATLPILAKEYGFQYELVEYKWPSWLHQQKEKHRVMWGYKILFLDVLFPLDVQKIIFVDADQVVRADLMELMEFDLGGAPYGYVPFCESRREMDGFRFWKQGYWANHLAGRKYHISALYVIDLQKFRQIAAGDRLRGQYQGLSQDPNSLSNLDQDLPNNMIHQVKIKSLPQEWLWCETWCDDGSKSQAKTIDLCNNPLTKEPKLDSANRIIPEWNEYDQEIKRVLSQATANESDSKTHDNVHSEL